MRGTEYLILVVMIGVFVALTVGISTNLNQVYPDNPINITNLTGSYDKISEIEHVANESYEKFQTLGSEDKSWFQKIGAGIVAIPYVVINFPLLIVKAVNILISFSVTALGGVLNTTLILAIITITTIYALREFFGFFQRVRA